MRETADERGEKRIRFSQAPPEAHADLKKGACIFFLLQVHSPHYNIHDSIMVRMLDYHSGGCYLDPACRMGVNLTDHWVPQHNSDHIGSPFCQV